MGILEKLYELLQCGIVHVTVSLRFDMIDVATDWLPRHLCMPRHHLLPWVLLRSTADAPSVCLLGRRRTVRGGDVGFTHVNDAPLALVQSR